MDRVAQTPRAAKLPAITATSAGGLDGRSLMPAPHAARQSLTLGCLAQTSVLDSSQSISRHTEDADLSPGVRDPGGSVKNDELGHSRVEK